jgi:hypothetical protein
MKKVEDKRAWRPDMEYRLLVVTFDGGHYFIAPISYSGQHGMLAISAPDH